MSTLAGSALYIAQAAALVNMASRPDATQNGAGGRLHVMPIVLAFLGTEVTGDIAPLCILPKGALIIPHLCRYNCEGDPSDGAVTMDVGTATDPDAFADGLVLTAGGPFLFTAPAEPAASKAPLRIGSSALGADDVIIYATYAGVAGTLTARSTLFWLVFELQSS